MVEATPDIPESTPSTSNTNIKPATPDLIQFNDEEIPVEFMTNLIFEEIGGQEIISIARNDIVNGQRVTYNPIKNVSLLGLQYNPQNIFSIPSSSRAEFNGYAIKLENHIPAFGEGTGERIFPDDPDVNRRELRETIYVEKGTGDLVVNITNLSDNEEVEIQMLFDGSSFNDIIY